MQRCLSYFKYEFSHIGTTNKLLFINYLNGSITKVTTKHPPLHPPQLPQFYLENVSFGEAFSAFSVLTEKVLVPLVLMVLVLEVRVLLEVLPLNSQRAEVGHKRLFSSVVRYEKGNSYYGHSILKIVSISNT